MFTLDELYEMRHATTWARIHWREIASREWDNDEREEYESSNRIADTYVALSDRITDEIIRMEKSVGIVRQ
jgi:hypothetical protein